MNTYLTPVQVEMINQHVINTQANDGLTLLMRLFVLALFVLLALAAANHVWEGRQLEQARRDDELERETQRLAEKRSINDRLAARRRANYRTVTDRTVTDRTVITRGNRRIFLDHPAANDHAALDRAVIDRNQEWMEHERIAA